MKQCFRLACIIGALLTLVGCSERELTADVYALHIVDDSTEQDAYARGLADYIERSYSIDDLEKITLNLHTAANGQMTSEVLFDDFLSTENRQTILVIKVAKALKQASSMTVDESAVSQLLRAICNGVGTESEHARIIALAGRFPICYDINDKSLVRRAADSSTHDKAKLLWMVHGERYNDIAVRSVLSRFCTIVHNPITAKSYPECGKQGAERVSNHTSDRRSMIVASFLSAPAEADVLVDSFGLVL
jgi:hypothetical protein